jgi:nucleoside-diphosphate-sugar epimerase
MTMRILVTGYHGYIGTVLSRLLLASGHEVVGADIHLYERCKFGDDEQLAVKVLRKDIRDLDPADLADCEAVAHLAGLCNDPLGDLLPEATSGINHRATVRLAEVARAAGVERFVFSSSCSVYGAAGTDWVDERSPPVPVTAYGQSKLDAERDVRRLETDSFSPVYLRSATAYGFSPRMRFDLVLNNLVAYACAKGDVLIKSDGKPWRPIVHIEDISRAFKAAIEAPRECVHNEVFNVGITTENYQVREIAELVRTVVPGSTIRYAPTAGPDKRSYRVDCSKISRLLPGFRPQWNLTRGAHELYQRFEAIGLTVEDFEGPRYQRLAHLKGLLNRGFVDNTFRVTPAFTAEEAAPAAVA